MGTTYKQNYVCAQVLDVNLDMFNNFILIGIGIIDCLYCDPYEQHLFEFWAFERYDHGQHLKDKSQSHAMGATK